MEMANEQAVPATAHVSKPKLTAKPAVKAAAAKKVAAKKVAAKKAKPAADGKASMKDQLAARKENYTKHKLEGGKIAIDNGDEVAEALRAMTLEEVYKYAAKTLEVPL